jgi:DNA-binding winged helix-turn-helix (wHTH) protein
VRISFSDFVLDLDTRQVLRGSAEVHLSPKSFDLLAALVDARPKALSKDHLQGLLWPDSFVTEGNLSVLVSEIRRALDDDAEAPRFVRTVPRFGYAFLGEARREPEAQAVAAAAGSHWLLWGRRKFELVEGESIVGRDPRCQVHLDVPGVSRRHARLLVDAGTATIEDLGSKNGTRKNGQQLRGSVLIDDEDRLQFGPVKVEYRHWPEVESTVTGTDLTGD